MKNPCFQMFPNMETNGNNTDRQIPEILLKNDCEFSKDNFVIKTPKNGMSEKRVKSEQKTRKSEQKMRNFCEICNYETTSKWNMVRHLKSLKHKNNCIKKRVKMSKKVRKSDKSEQKMRKMRKNENNENNENNKNNEDE